MDIRVGRGRKERKENEFTRWLLALSRQQGVNQISIQYVEPDFFTTLLS